MEDLHGLLPGQWMDSLWLGAQILLILTAAFILQRFVGRCLSRLGNAIHCHQNCWYRYVAACAG